MLSTLQGEEDLFYLLFLTCCFNKLLDVLYGSSVVLIVAPLCGWLLVAARCPWPHHAPHFLHQKDYDHPFRKQFTWRRKVSAFSLLVLRTTLILNLVQILVFGRHMTINMMILNTLIFALGRCGVRLSRARGGDIVSGTCSTTTGRHGAQPRLDEETSLGVDSGCSYSSQDLELQVVRTANVPRPDLRDSAPACAAASSSPPCKNNASESAVDTAANPRRSANDQDEPALPKGGETIPPSPAKSAHAWVIDAGAPFHVTGDRESLRNLHPSLLPEVRRPPMASGPHLSVVGTPMGSVQTDRITLPSGLHLSVVGTGSVQTDRITLPSGLHLSVVGTGSVQTDRITLPNVRYAPGLLMNLISMAQLCREHSLVMIFEPDVLYIKKTRSAAEIIGQASRDGSGLYVLDYLHLTSTACRTSTGSHPHLDAEAEPCGIGSGHSSSQSTGTAQQPMPAYACRMDLSASSSTQTQVVLHSTEVSTEVVLHSTEVSTEVVLDSGCGFHMTGFFETLKNPEPTTGSVVGISGKPLPVTAKGSIEGAICIDNVRYVPGLPKLLISVSQLTRERSARVIFERYCCRVQRMSDDCTIGQGKMVGDVYTLDFLKPEHEHEPGPGPG